MQKLRALICIECDKSRVVCSLVIKVLALQGSGIEHERSTLIEPKMDFPHLCNFDECVHTPRGYDRCHAAVKCKEKNAPCIHASEIHHPSVALSLVQYELRWQCLDFSNYSYEYYVSLYFCVKASQRKMPCLLHSSYFAFNSSPISTTINVNESVITIK